MPRIPLLPSEWPSEDPLGRPVPAGPLTFEEFHDWCDEDTWAEWVDGEIELVSPASERHQSIADFLTALLGIVGEDRGAGRVLSAPFLMRLPVSLRRGREPDVIFVTTEHLDRLRPTYLDGPADLVIEVVSPESLERDRHDKFREYEAAGIPEYWLIDPDRQVAEMYQLGPDGRYVTAFAGRSGIYRSQVLPALRLNVNWLWQTPRPGLLDVVRELGLLD